MLQIRKYYGWGWKKNETKKNTCKCKALRISRKSKKILFVCYLARQRIQMKLCSGSTWTNALTLFTERMSLRLFVLVIFRSSCPEVFSIKGVLENFTKFTGKHLYRVCLFFSLAPATLFKKDSSTGVFLLILWNF